jgi:cyclase
MLLMFGFVRPSIAQRRPHPSWNNPPVTIEGNPVQALFVQGSGKTRVYMLAGAGAGNITLQVGEEGVLLVDTGSARMAEKTVAAIKHLTQQLTDLPIRWVINTHFHPDSTGGNEVISKAGQALLEDTVSNVIFGKRFDIMPATIVAQENVLKRMSAPTGQKAPTPTAAWPLLTYIAAKQEMFFNGEPIEIISMPAAHTDGDSIVFFRHSDVLSAGGVFVETTFPVIDLKAGGTIKGTIDALNRIIDIAIPEDHQEGGTYVIPGEGHLSDEADVVVYRDMVTIIRDRIQDMVTRGLTLDQVKAARPAIDYEVRYATPSWTADMFVEAVYKTLTPSAAPVKTQNPANKGAGQRR